MAFGRLGELYGIPEQELLASTLSVLRHPKCKLPYLLTTTLMSKLNSARLSHLTIKFAQQ